MAVYFLLDSSLDQNHHLKRRDNDRLSVIELDLAINSLNICQRTNGSFQCYSTVLVRFLYKDHHFKERIRQIRSFSHRGAEVNVSSNRKRLAILHKSCIEDFKSAKERFLNSQIVEDNSKVGSAFQLTRDEPRSVVRSGGAHCTGHHRSGLQSHSRPHATSTCSTSSKWAIDMFRLKKQWIGRPLNATTKKRSPEVLRTPFVKKYVTLVARTHGTQTVGFGEKCQSKVI